MKSRLLFFFLALFPSPFHLYDIFLSCLFSIPVIYFYLFLFDIYPLLCMAGPGIAWERQ